MSEEHQHRIVFNDYVTPAWVTGAIAMIVGFISVLYTKESYAKDWILLRRKKVESSRRDETVPNT